MNFMFISHPNPLSSHRASETAQARAIPKFAHWTSPNQSIWLSQGRRQGIVEQGPVASPRGLARSVALRRSR